MFSQLPIFTLIFRELIAKTTKLFQLDVQLCSTINHMYARLDR